MTDNVEDKQLKWMKEALKVAQNALKVKEVPVGCVIVDDESEEIISYGHNMTNMLKNPTRHAEFEALDKLFDWCKSNGKDIEKVLGSSTLYVTCEPCIMCASALRQVNLKKCVYGCSNERFGGCGTVLDIAQENENKNQGDPMTQVQKGVLSTEAIELLQSFYAQENPFAPEPKSKANRSVTCLKT